MQRGTFRIWLQPGVKKIPPGWGGAKEISAEWPNADTVDVTVEGDGGTLEEYLRSRRDLFNSWDRLRDEEGD